MNARSSRRFAGLLVLAALLAMPRAGSAQDAPSPRQAEDEKAIRAVDAAFARDYNRGDSKALAALFTEDAEAIEAGGERLQGRAPIEGRFAETFAASPGVQIAIEIGSIRFLSPDVAREEGHTIITAKDTRRARPYTALFVKRDGKWLISGVREEEEALVGPHERLRELEWMVGDWVDQSPGAEVRINCRWSEDGNFLIRDFSVKQRGRAVMTVAQRIGWDPMARRIRSWEFDSEGGFSEGTWSREGDRWMIKRAGVRADGVAASSTNVMVKERSDLVRWASTDRVIGEELIPEGESFVMVRVPPPPQAPKAPGQSATPKRSQ